MSTEEVTLLQRLEDFFSEGSQTDAVGNFLNGDEIEAMLGAEDDSRAALDMFAYYKKYTQVVDALLDLFVAREVKAGRGTSMEDIAQDIMKEWGSPEPSGMQYLCTDYIAGAMDFDAFKELLMSVHDIHAYCLDDDEEDDEEEGEGADTEGKP